MNTTEFDEIRPYNDEELSGVFEELIADPAFQKVVAGVIPDVPFEMLAQKMRACRTKLEFQKTFCYGLLWKLAGDCTDGISLDHTAIPDKSKAYTYISNHRDIILDSGFLSVLLVDQGMDTVEIAIGDNLLIYPWIKKFVRVNKSFIQSEKRISPSGLHNVKDVPKTLTTVLRTVYSRCWQWGAKGMWSAV